VNLRPHFVRRPCPGVLTLAGLLALSGCAGGGTPEVVGPVADPETAVRSVEVATALEGSTRILFDWHLTEEGVRVGGRGVARIEPPDRARLDLFLDNGEGVAAAILIGDDLTLPVSLPGDILPPPALLWGTVGMVRLGAGVSVLDGQELADGGRMIRTRLPTGEGVIYRVLDERLQEVSQTEGGTVVKRLAATYDDGDRIPAEAVYRDLAAFRELTLTRERVEYVDGFPSDIWHF